MSVFIIAEAGSSHDNDLQKAYRLIEAAKECGADAVKFQWTSDAHAMAESRGMDGAAEAMYAKYLEKPLDWLDALKAHCDKIGIEFMCTVFFIGDVRLINKYVQRFKIASFEGDDRAFYFEHVKYKKPIIVSNGEWHEPESDTKHLHCVAKYPAALDELHLGIIRGDGLDGFSDHTANVLTGAAAVAAGAKIIEAHIRLHDTDPKNPDYGHSLVADRDADCNMHEGEQSCGYENDYFGMYVHFIRQVERML